MTNEIINSDDQNTSVDNLSTEDTSGADATAMATLGSDASAKLFSVNLNEEEFKTLHENAKNMRDMLKPVLNSLSKAGKRRLISVSKSKTYFIENIIKYVKSNPEFISPTMDQDKMIRDTQTMEKLNLIREPLVQSIHQIDDTIALLGNDAYIEGLEYYRIIQAASKRGTADARRIHDNLKQHFTRSKASTENQDTTPA